MLESPLMPEGSTKAGAQASSDLSGDIWGGLAAMLVALPSAIAFGVAIFSVLGGEYAAQGAMAGIAGAIAMGLVAPTFGGAPRLISAPCGPAAAVMSALAAELLAGRNGGAPMQVEQVLIVLTLVAVLSGALQVFYGSIGGGKLIKYIPFPVVSGYLSGVGIILILKQIPYFFGYPKTMPMAQGLMSPGDWRLPAITVAAATIALMVLAPKLTKRVPAPILGVLAGVLTYFGLGFAAYPELLHLDHNKLVIGSIGGGLSGLFSGFGARFAAVGGIGFGDLRAVVMPALTLSVLLSIDTLKTCVIVDTLTRSRHNSNRELIGQGLGNLATAIIGGAPGAGAMGPTMVNINSGGKTRLSSLLEGAFVLAAFLLLGSLIGWVPLAALAGILIVVGFRMVDWHSFHLLKQRSTALDFTVSAAVVAVALKYNLVAAAGAGLALAVALFVREQMQGSVIRRRFYGNELYSKQFRLPDERAALEEHGAETAICQLQGSLFFGTTDQLYSELEPDFKKCRYVILDMQRVTGVDFTGAHMLELIEGVLGERGGKLLFSNLPDRMPTGQDLQAYFDEVGLVRPTRHIRLFETLDEALEWAEDSLLEVHGFHQEITEKPLDLAEIELTREFDAEAIAALRGLAVEKSFDPGQTIFKRKDEGDEIYLIRRGMVRIILPLKSGKHHHVATFARGNFFGDIAFLAAQKRTADAVVTAPTDLYLLSRKRFDEFSRRNPEMGVRVYARLAKALALRLRDTDGELRKLQDS